MHLTAGDLTVVNSIPVTTLARMMLDLAAVVDQRAVEQVQVQGRRRDIGQHRTTRFTTLCL